MPPDHSRQTPIPPVSVEAQRLTGFLSSGGRVGVIVGPGLSGKTGLLHETCAAFAGPVFKVGNPLVTPLGLTRIMVQVDAEDDGGDDAILLTAHLVSRATRDQPALLAIDDAHTLDDAALSVLAGLAVLEDGERKVLLLLAGRAELAERLSIPSLGALHDADRVCEVSLDGDEDAPPAASVQRWIPAPLSGGLAVPAPPAPFTQPVLAASELPLVQPLPLVQGDAVPLPVPVARRSATPAIIEIEAPPARLAVASRPSRSWRVPLFASLVLAGGALAAGAALWRPGPGAGPPGPSVAFQPVPPPTAVPDSATLPSVVAPAIETPAAVKVPAPSPPAPPDIALQVPDETPVVPASGDSDRMLRLKFREFLTRTGRGNLVNNPRRFESLFQEYVHWRSRPAE